jgi:hypothetical protein
MDAVYPIDSVETLHDPYPAPVRISQWEQVTSSCQYKDRVCMFG